ncbi:MAG: LytTR family DNA-binding domain-containing protein [Bacteroidota bacterium]
MIRSIIIDDEEDARESLRLSLQKFCPQVEIIASCDGPIKGIDAIEQADPDLIFLDVQMPHMSGFDLLGKFPEARFQTIFVTAHDKYAIRAIRFSALDYLMKPVDIDELVSAVGRVEIAREGQIAPPYQDVLHNVKHRLGKDGKLAVPVAEGMVFLDIQDIIYCQAEGSYTRLFLDQKKDLLVSKSLKDFESILSPRTYCRVHHSNLINLNQVARYVRGEGGYVIMRNGDHVDISRRKKEEFMRLIARI